MAASDFDQVVEQQHTALDAFARGDDKPLAALWSKADDVTLGNPFGPFVSGFRQVAATMEAAAASYREGEASGFDLIAKQCRGRGRLSGRGGTLQGQDGRACRCHSCVSSLHEYLPSGRWQLEDRASSRRPDNDAPAPRLSPPGVGPPHLPTSR
jgi:hypothetical protein